MPILLGLVAIVLLGALARPPHRHAVQRLVLIAVALSATGCDGCSPASTPGPLQPDENTRFHISDRLGSSALVLNYEGEVILVDPEAGIGDRLLAGASLASEVLPVSIGDVRDVASWSQRALKAAPERKMLAAASSATRTAKHAAKIKWKGFSKGSEARHYTKHGGEFGNITQAEYKKKAKAFAADAGNYQEQVVGNFVVKYDPSTRRTLVGHAKSREIRTFYKADNRDADPFAAAVKMAENLSKQ